MARSSSYSLSNLPVYIVLPIIASTVSATALLVVLYSAHLENIRGSLAGHLLALFVILLTTISVSLAVSILLQKVRTRDDGESALEDAGLWVTKTAFGNLPHSDARVAKYPWVKNPTMLGSSTIQRDLAEWLEQWRSDLLAQSNVLSDEITRDMQMATEFQQAFLNRPYPEVPQVYIEGRLRLEFNHLYKPAMAVGGDFFDITPIGNECAGILIADVMGHGIRSALITAILRALMAELSPQARNAPHFLKEMNREFCDILESLPNAFFASAFYLVADTTSRIATYASAGHPAPFFLNRDRAKVSRLGTPQPKSSALGLISDENFGAETVRLQHGNSFIFFTDGVYECTNPDGEEYGLARFEKVLQSNIYKSTPQILNAIMNSINAFVRGEAFEDDLCLVSVDVTTEPP